MRLKSKLAISAAALSVATIVGGIVFYPSRKELVNQWTREQILLYGSVQSPSFRLRNEPANPSVFKGLEALFDRGLSVPDAEQYLMTYSENFEDSLLRGPLDASKPSSLRAWYASILASPVPPESFSRIKDGFARVTDSHLPSLSDHHAGINFASSPTGTDYLGFPGLKRIIPEPAFPRNAGGVLAFSLNVGFVPPQHITFLIAAGDIDPFVVSDNLSQMGIEQRLRHIGINLSLPRHSSSHSPSQLGRIKAARCLDQTAGYAVTDALLRELYAEDALSAVRAKLLLESHLRIVRLDYETNPSRNYYGRPAYLFLTHRQRDTSLQAIFDYFSTASLDSLEEK